MGVGKSTFAFSASSITIDGGSTTIGITRDNQSYSHKLLHGYGDIATLAVGTTSYTWTPTASALTEFFQEVPAQKSRLIDVYLDTYNGSTKVGRDVHALTVTLSEATGKPSISGFAITDSNSTTNGWGVIVDGKSTLTASATPTAKYGATISKNVFTCTYNSKTYESYYINDLIASLPLTTTPTSFTIGYKSTDSRGFSTTSTLSKTIAKYQAPTIETFEVIRCDTSGNESDSGTKAKVIIKGSWAAIKVGTAYKNVATLKVGYKTKAATSYTYQTIDVTGGTVDISQILSATLTADTDYEFSVQLTDSFDSYAKTGVGCSNAASILYVSADGKEVIIGAQGGNNIVLSGGSIELRKGENIYTTITRDDNAGTNISATEGLRLFGDGMWLTSGEGRLTIDTSGNQIGDGLDVTITTTSGGQVYINKGKLHVGGGVTEDIPVHNSGNCNSLTTTGKYYIGSSGSNKPVSQNGWLESKKYSTDYCYQTYVTYTGLKYERLMSASKWGGWTRIYVPVSLYDNSSGTSGNITLSQTAANFDYMEVFYFDNLSGSNVYMSEKVYKPNGRNVTLTGISNNGQTTQLTYTSYHISGTAFNTLGEQYINFSQGSGSPGWGNQATSSYHIKVYKIIGYK